MKNFNYQSLLSRNKKMPNNVEEVSCVESFTQATVTVKASYDDGKKYLYRFFYWLLPTHSGNSEIRLSVFDYTLLN